MRINYAEDQTDDVVELYNWKGDLCELNADGDLGKSPYSIYSFLSFFKGSAHGFICAGQSEMEACKATEGAGTLTTLSISLLAIILMQ